MNKKGLIWLVVAIIVIVAVACGLAIYSRNNDAEENKSNTKNGENENTVLMDETNNTKSTNITNEDNEKDENKNVSNNQNKTLVVYYSAQSHTKAVAEKIANNLNADIFEIVPEQIYTSEDLDWTNNNSRVSKEHNNESIRNIKLVKDKVDNIENYDTILIGYPIWWGIAAWPVDTFVKANNFNGKQVIPFCTSSSSGLGESGKLLEKEGGSGNWLEGHRFNSNPSDSDIKEWTDSLK